MGLSDSIIGDIGEQLAELGTHVVKQTGKAAASVVKGVVTGGKSDSSTEGSSASMPLGQQMGSSDIKKKPISSTAMDPATQQKLAAIRQNLRAMMTPSKSTQQEQPKYISGKPGGSMAEQEKMQEKINKENKKMSELSISAKAGQGSGEKHRGVSG